MIFEDPQRAADLVTQLSELFRFHLQHELRKEQTLAEEWQLAQRYLDLESVRLESRLRLDVDLDPVCLKRSLPALSLLCLVENAIKHGIAPNREPGQLRVRARPAADGWTLEVSNTVGVQAATLSTQTGLANLRERLALGFGDRARLQASLVCRVDSTRWPVNEACTAICAVSRSRISPTMMMSGSWRSSVRTPAAKSRSIA